MLRVLGNRKWERTRAGVAATRIEPVAEVPIVYERAFGGYDDTDPNPKKHKLEPRNPVGTGVVAAAERRVGKPVHNFEYPDGEAETAGPAGFGAIDAHWATRLGFQGTYDDNWTKTRKPLLPEDWDARALLCSPQDQQPAQFLRGGETVELLNLTRKGKLKFELPKTYLSFSTKISTRAGTRAEEHRARLSTVILEPDHPRVIMVWTTSLLVHENID